MNILDNLITRTLSLESKSLLRAILFMLGATAALGCVLIYFFHTARSSRIEKLSQLHEQSRKNDKIVSDSNKIKAEEERIQTMLNENKGFNIKTFVEQFCAEQKLKPEAEWTTETRSIEGNETFDEVLLPVTFKNQTTQALVTMLSGLDKQEMIYIKELIVQKEDKKKITITLTIATQKRKQFWED